MNETGQVPKPAPALPFNSPLRFLRELRTDALGFLTRWAELGGGVARFQSRSFTSLLVTNPEAVHHVLQDNHQNYVKEVRSARIFRVGLGNGLFLSEGDTWRAQRQTIQPAFHRRRLAEMTTTIVQTIAERLDRWTEFSDSRQEFNVSEEASRLTLEVVSRTLLGQELREEAVALGQAVATIFEHFSYLLRHILVAPPFIPTARNRAFRHALATTRSIVDRLIKAGLSAREQRSDLLSLLLDAYGGQRTQPQELRDIVTTLLGAGIETAAVALSWAWYLLGKNSEAQSKLHQEVRAVLGHRQPGFEDLRRLTYTRMVIDETLRLFPPAWVISRTAVGEDEVCGFRIPAGSSVYASAWVTHRSPHYWENPEAFDPERFSPARRNGRLPHAYYPFGGGPRSCAGDQFSLAELCLALAMTAQRFRITVNRPVVPVGHFTLHPRGGVHATISRS